MDPELLLEPIPCNGSSYPSVVSWNYTVIYSFPYCKGVVFFKFVFLKASSVVRQEFKSFLSLLSLRLLIIFMNREITSEYLLRISV